MFLLQVASLRAANAALFRALAAKSGLGVRMPPEITDDSLGIAPATREHGCC